MSTLKYWAQKWFPQISQIDEINKESIQQTNKLSEQHKTLHDTYVDRCPQELAGYFYQYAKTLEEHGRHNKSIDFSSEPDKMVTTLEGHLKKEKQLSRKLEEILSKPTTTCYQLKILLQKATELDSPLSK